MGEPHPPGLPEYLYIHYHPNTGNLYTSADDGHQVTEWSYKMTCRRGGCTTGVCSAPLLIVQRRFCNDLLIPIFKRDFLG